MAIETKKIISTKEARKILGTTAQELTDSEVDELVLEVERTTDVIIEYMSGSKIKRDIINSKV